MITTAGSSESGVLRGDLRAIAFAAREDLKNSPTVFSRTAPWQLHAGFASVTGHRSANEDCGYANLREGLFLVADGIGGYSGGAVASHLLVDTIPPLLVPTLRDGDVPNDGLQLPIREAVCAAQKAMEELASRDPSLAEMGSTIALGVIAGQTLFLTHLGDSRVYLVRRGTIRQLTKDHSLVQALIDSGLVTPEAAKRHIYRHVISESVRAKRASAAEVVAHELLPGDRLLFATDGLTDVVEEDLLGWTITSLANPQHAADVLVCQALDNGSRDNVTCLVVHVDPAQGRPFQKRCRFARKSTNKALTDRVR